MLSQYLRNNNLLHEQLKYWSQISCGIVSSFPDVPFFYLLCNNLMFLMCFPPGKRWCALRLIQCAWESQNDMISAFHSVLGKWLLIKQIAMGKEDGSFCWVGYKWQLDNCSSLCCSFSFCSYKVLMWNFSYLIIIKHIYMNVQMNQMVHLKLFFLHFWNTFSFAGQHILTLLQWKFQWSPVEIFTVFFSPEMSRCWLSVPIWNTNSSLSNARVS